MLRIFAVTENSMTPEFSEGDFVLVAKIPFFLSVRAGDVVVFHHPPYGMLIKRVQEISPDGQELTVWGTNSNSIDSRTFGAIDFKEVLGKVIWHVKRHP